ncbi:hypothetical protein DJ73_17420 [Halorubrum sp. Ea1]|nr:hypothetical protein [Halorubrum sp. Ea1]OYR49684.1 hypothetical protein DJ73_17420 [Halorubrum sp. Ea1]
MGLPPTADALPAALVDRDQWVCWRPHQRDNKPTKVPIIPGTTQFASTTNPETWCSFQTAREAVTTTSVEGLGFVFTADDPLIGIDLDDCRDTETGAPTEWADQIIDQLESYTEVSPSGTGYHILVTGTLPEGRNRAGDLELYERSRFFTVTGDHVASTPTTITARSDVVDRLHATELADATAESAGTTDGSAAAPRTATTDTTPGDTATSTSGAATLSDEELLERARHAANGEKFTRLWNGTTSGYESHSEADMALCRLLAFWTGCDAHRIDRLFRRSGLARDKWDAVHYADGSTYGEKTIERAIARTDEEYTPPESTTSSGGNGETPTTAATDSAAPATEPTAATDGSPQDSRPSTAPSEPESDSPEHPQVDERSACPTTPERVHARRERIVELTDRVEALLAENERLRRELQAERERRYELEEAHEEPTTGWWPL